MYLSLSHCIGFLAWCGCSVHSPHNCPAPVTKGREYRAGSARGTRTQRLLLSRLVCCGVSRVWGGLQAEYAATIRGTVTYCCQFNMITMILGYYSKEIVCIRLALQIKLHIHLWSCIEAYISNLAWTVHQQHQHQWPCCYDGAVFGHPEPEWGRLRCGEGRCCQDHSVELRLWSNT